MSARWEYYPNTAGKGFRDTHYEGQYEEWPTGTDICKHLNDMEAQVAALTEWRDKVLLEYVEGVMTNGLGDAIEAALIQESE